MTSVEVLERQSGESACEYIERVKPYLPKWPEEVIESYLHFGWGVPFELENLDFSKLSFEKQTWSKGDIPGQEVFRSSWDLADSMRDLDYIAARPGMSWVVDYMFEHGTWNTGIILLHNPETLPAILDKCGKALNQPLYLLEGYHRLTTLHWLINLNRANDSHELWIARLIE